MPALPALTGRRQRGAISIMAAVGLTAVISAALLAVDLGNLFYTKRHLQSVADNAALSAVNDLTLADSIALDTARLNEFTVPGGQGNALATVVGRYDEATPEGQYVGSFTPGGDPELQNAVRVTVTTQEPLFFMLGSREVTATATATRADVAGLSIGSGLLSIDTEQSALLNGILGGLLHTSLSLDAVSYQGLATANVRLLDLVKADASVGTVEELLAADISVADLIRLTATALSQSEVANVDLSVLNTLSLLALKVPGDLSLKLGDLLKVSLADSSAAANAELNVLQLISLSAQVANGEHFLNVPMVGINLPGLVTLNLALSLIEAPSIAIGPPGQDENGEWRTRAHTAQARLKLDLVVGELLGGLLRVPLYVELAKGQAWLESIDCRWPREDSTVMIGATSGIAGIYLGNVNADAMTNRETAATVTPAQILNVLGLLTITAQAGIDLPGGAADLEFHGPFNDQNTQRVSGVSTAGLAQSLVDTLVLDTGGLVGGLLNLVLGLIGLDLDEILKLVLQALTPVLGLVDSILAPVLSLLGLQLGYADVTNFYLTCGNARLVR
jgi:uncharacterized membrane protein